MQITEIADAIANRITAPIHTMSIGAGVQSSTAGMKASAGEFTPMPECGIFADTKAEPASVYKQLNWLCGVEVKFQQDGRAYVETGHYSSGALAFPVHIVSAGDLEADALRERVRKDGKGSWIPSGVPHYSINADGSKGHGPRQCTHDFKLLVINKERRRLVGPVRMLEWRRKHKLALKEISVWESELATWKRRKKRGENVGVAPLRPDNAWAECQTDALCIAWIGISADEPERVKDSRTPWIRNYYPLFENGITRNHCLGWMLKNGHPRPPRSACVFCPYHSDDEWRRLRDEEPFDFARAVAFDVNYRAAKIRTVSQKGFVPFLHDSRKPLSEVNFDEPSHKQPELFGNECEGMCGV